MSSIRDLHNNLFRLYEHYVGEPDSAKDVYGYWLFILGYLVGAAGVFTFIVGYAGDTGSYFQIRVSGVTAAAGLSLCLFGIVLMLPVRTRGIQASAIGLVVALVGVVSFGVVYPQDWRGYGADWSVEVITIYAAGIAIIAGVTALVPIVTGRKGMFVEEEGATEDPPVLTGDALEGAQFAVFRDQEGDWRWHVLHLEALAASEGSTLTRPDATTEIEAVKSSIGSAGLMELTTSAFRLYESRDGEWQWTLVRDDGSVVASCASMFDGRDGAEESVSFLKDRGPDADVIEIDGAAFTYTERRDEWFWQLLDDDRTPLATSDRGHQTQGAAEAAARDFAEAVGDARLLVVDHFGVELLERNGGWGWRFVDDDDRELAESTNEYDSRRDAEEAVEALLPELESASISVAGEPIYEHYRSGEQWLWRLVDDTETVVAHTPDGVDELDEAEAETQAFCDAASDATVVEIEDAEYEVYQTDDPSADDVSETPEAAVESGSSDRDVDPTDESLPVVVDEDGDGEILFEEGEDDRTDAEPTADWNWRLVTDDRDVIAASNEPHPDAESAAEAIERVREQASQADLIEFENAAFQVYEADDSEWRWRLIDEDGNVLADSGAEHTSRSEAAAAMMTLKEQAPDAELLEIDTAAFELFVDDDGRWGWRLIDEAGKLVAEDPNTHPDRASAKAAMDRLLSHLDSDIRTMDRAIFQTYAVEDWHWRFVLPTGEVVAVDDDAHSTRDELVETIGDIKEAAATAGTHTIGDVAVQLYERGEWHWRVLDRDREPIADSTVSYPNRQTALVAVEELESYAGDAPTFAIESTAIRLSENGGWHWELIDRDRIVSARSAETLRSKVDAKEVIDDIRILAPTAGRVDFDVASFELFADEADEWHWRLIDEGGRTVARGSETYYSSEQAEDALDDTRSVIEKASILEIESVSFELHTDDDGWVWRLVDRHGSTMADSTRSYETRTDAREAMNAVKATAPEGWITFTE